MNKKYLWLLMLPLFLMMFFPKNTYASSEINNTQLEIFGYMEGRDEISTLAGCYDCYVIVNQTGHPKSVRIYFPTGTFIGNHQYEISWSFQFKSPIGFNVWPEPPSIYYGQTGSTGILSTQTQLEWSNTLDVTAEGNYVRENFFKTNLVIDQAVVPDNRVFWIEMPLTNYSGQSYDVPYTFILVNFGISITDGTILPDDPVSDLHGTNVRLDELKNINLSIWDYVVQIFSTLLNLPLKIGEKIGELLNGLSIWDTISNIYNFIIDIPRRIGETVGNLLEFLFIPSDGFYENTINKYYDDITNSLGMLWFPFDFIENFVSKYVALETNPIINIPNIKDPVYGVTLIEARSFNIQEIFQHGAIGTVYDIYMVFAGAFIVVLFINFLIRKFNHIINGNESDVA